MDPNATLQRLRNLIHGEHQDAEDCEEISVLFSALDNWLCEGGFLPKEWERV